MKTRKILRWVVCATLAALSLGVSQGHAQSGHAQSAPEPQGQPPSSLPAVDGLNGKLEVSGGAWWPDDSNPAVAAYGVGGALTFPLAHRWGAQVDAVLGNDGGTGTVGGAGHLFWRDPAVGLLGAFGSYVRTSGLDFGRFGSLNGDAVHLGAEGQYYWRQFIFTAAAGLETSALDSPPPGWGPVPDRFFDSVTAAFYATDNLQLSVGQRYAGGMNGLALGVENAFALGNGHMMSVFGDALIADGSSGVRGGVRFYFGRRDKSLIDRHRQDDPPPVIEAQGCGYGFHRTGYGQCVLNHPGPDAKPAPGHPGCWINVHGQLRCYR